MACPGMVYFQIVAVVPHTYPKNIRGGPVVTTGKSMPWKRLWKWHGTRAREYTEPRRGLRLAGDKTKHIGYLCMYHRERKCKVKESATTPGREKRGHSFFDICFPFKEPRGGARRPTSA